ncbi:hypothetical protein GN244_ATG15139 [Phytophthora infestans]|uniref:Secreted RxLR effector peptide protein n=1 Tax=Phytophthora infestans TaxID=4787 RepID=A0A833T331_PHYIN|nr:hypothetical protein GN244_ATG15139 [Phytophthora infestans]
MPTRHNIAKGMALAVFVAAIIAALAAAKPEPIASDTWILPLSHQGDVNHRRLLRAADEDRVISTSTVESLVKSAVSTEQLKAWAKKGDTTNYVFKALQLQKAGDNLLDNPQLAALISYLRLFNEANPAKKTTLIATLTTHYGNQDLARIIEAGQQVPKTARMANRLQTEQIQLWMGQGKSPEQVFGLLKLNKFWPFGWVSSDLFSKPGLTTWIQYLDDFNEANPDKKKTLISILSARYSDKTLANMLIEANKVRAGEGRRYAFREPSLQCLDQVRGRFPIALRHRPSHHVHFDQPQAVAKMIVKANGNPNTINIGQRLESELQRDWRLARQSPYDVFIMMNLDVTLDKVFENPLFGIWYNYGRYVTEMNLGKTWNPAVALTRVYGSDRKLADVLMAAEKVPSTKAMAAELQNWQVTLWLYRMLEPRRVYSLLRVDEGASRNLFREYVEAYEEVGDKTIGDLKTLVAKEQNNALQCAPSELELHLAIKDGAWLARDD